MKLVDIKTRTKLILLIGLSLLATFLVGTISGHYLQKSIIETDERYEVYVLPTVYLEEIKANYWHINSLLLHMVIDDRRENVIANYEYISELTSLNDELLKKYMKVPSISKERDDLLFIFLQERREYSDLSNKALEMALSSNVSKAFDKYNARIFSSFENMIRALDKLNMYILMQSEKNKQDSAEKTLKTLHSMIGFIIFAGIVLLILGVYLAQNFTRILYEVTNFASYLSKNDFSKKLDEDTLLRKDEFGVMANALDTMQNNLKNYITQLDKTALALKVSNAQANKASEAKGLFLANMSHEIRTPLNAIIGMTHIAQKSHNSKVIEESLQKINDSSTHLLLLINDVLDMSKIEAEKLELNEEDFSLEKVLLDVSNVIAVRAKAKNQSIIIDLPYYLCRKFNGDNLRLTQVITNLFSNAVKFTPQGGKITLEVEHLEESEKESVLEFRLSDNGIGINPEQLSKVFLPFEQANNYIVRNYGGTGLGLAICKSIINLMGGDIRVESVLNEGSTFIFTIRLKNVKSEKEDISSTIDKNNVKVHIINEDTFEIRSLSSMFEDLDIEFAVYDSQFGAKINFSSNVFNLVFVEQKIYEENPEILTHLKQYPQNKVIFIAANMNFHEKEITLDPYIDRILTRPFLPCQIIYMINELLSKQETIEEKADNEVHIDFAGKKILLVEDIEINAEIVRAYLEDTGIIIDYAENGLEAVEKYIEQEGDYDLILMDIQMPVLDGFAATLQIRNAAQENDYKAVPIIAMTANAFKEDVDKCLAMGMDSHISKPIDYDTMIEELQKYMKKLSE